MPVPRHRISPLKQHWDSILKTLVEHMKLQVRMNVKKRCVEVKVRIRYVIFIDLKGHPGHWSYLEGSRFLESIHAWILVAGRSSCVASG